MSGNGRGGKSSLSIDRLVGGARQLGDLLFDWVKRARDGDAIFNWATLGVCSGGSIAYFLSIAFPSLSFVLLFTLFGIGGSAAGALIGRKITSGALVALP